MRYKREDGFFSKKLKLIKKEKADYFKWKVDTFGNSFCELCNGMYKHLAFSKWMYGCRDSFSQWSHLLLWPGVWWEWREMNKIVWKASHSMNVHFYCTLINSGQQRCWSNIGATSWNGLNTCWSPFWQLALYFLRTIGVCIFSCLSNLNKLWFSFNTKNRNSFYLCDRFLDFGLLCQMEKRHQFAMLASIVHIVNGDWASLVRALIDMDVVRPGTNIRLVTRVNHLYLRIWSSC